MVDQGPEPSKKMRRAPRGKVRRPRHRASKISDHRLRKVVAHFVRDHTAAEAAQATGLSVNSVHALYRKLRVFFFEVRLFNDYYGGADPETYQSANPGYELELLTFHAKRRAKKRGLASPSNEPDYHFAESCWRYDFHVLMRERQSDAVYGMMERHLVELIRICGPLGTTPTNPLAGAEAVLRQTDERIAWLMRNAPGFRATEDRLALSEALAITDDS